jgi:hypothetical protein
LKKQDKIYEKFLSPEEKKKKLLEKSDQDIYKSIMCPLKYAYLHLIIIIFRENCPDEVRPRWPISNKKTITKFGKKCPYAHHPSELRFPYSLFNQIPIFIFFNSEETKALKQGLKNTKDNLNKVLSEDIAAKKWIGRSVMYDCNGCGGKQPCTRCQLSRIVKLKEKEYLKATVKTNKKLVQSESVINC